MLNVLDDNRIEVLVKYRSNIFRPLYPFINKNLEDEHRKLKLEYEALKKSRDRRGLYKI